MKNKFACIMAGGKGERFWPESRENRPKQLLNLFSETPLIGMTVDRIKKIIPPENIFIITNRSYADPIAALLPEVPRENIIGEPASRNTAPCVALAAGMVAARDPEAVMALFPADHIIIDGKSFADDLMLAFENAADDLFTFGISPTFPSPDYGYIEAGSGEKISSVTRFVEKPERSRAETMIAQGNFYWNSGIFVWHVAAVMKAFQQHLPELAEFARLTAAKAERPDFPAFLEETFPGLPKISIDCAVMEKSSGIKVVRSSFDWNDVGSWSALRDYFPADDRGNVSNGVCRLLDSGENIVFSSDKKLLIAGIDLKDMLIVHSNDALLICPNSSVSKLRELLKQLNGDPDCKKYL